MKFACAASCRTPPAVPGAKWTKPWQENLFGACDGLLWLARREAGW